MGWIDIFFIILLAGACILGYSEGLINQLSSLSGVLLGIVAVWIGGDTATRIAASCMGIDLAEGGSFAKYSAAVVGCGVLFAVVWGFIWSIGKMLRRAVKKIRMSVIDGIFGSAFMIFKWSLVVSLILNLWYVIQPSSPIFFGSRLLEGKIFQAVMNLGPYLMGYIKDYTTNFTAPAL